MTQAINITEKDRDMLVSGLNESITMYHNYIKSYRENYADGAPECADECRKEIRAREELKGFLLGLKF